MGADLTQPDISVVPPAQGAGGPILQVENLRTWFTTENGVARAVDSRLRT
jgi:hypothetical protein